MILLFIRAVCASALPALLVACAAQVRVAPATLSPLAGAPAELTIADDVPIRLSTGYTRTVAARSRWRAVGVLPQGTVYRPVDSVFAIEGRHVHEAYLVLRGASLQGFYLPGEGNYSALQDGIPLPLNQGAQR
jgi:hypothetical protein